MMKEKIEHDGGGEPNPEAIIEMSMSFAASRVLSVCVQLGVFSHIAGGQHTVTEIARAAGASVRGMSMLLDASATFKLLRKTGDGRFELMPLSEKFLVRGSPDYCGAMMEHDVLWNSWGNLAEVVRTGKPPLVVEDPENAGHYFPTLVRSVHPIHSAPAHRVAEVLGVGTTSRGAEVIDVACGSGVWGIACLQADPQARLTLHDFPSVLLVASEFVQRYGVEDRCDYLPGELKEVDFGESVYDIALLGHIIHSEGEQSARDLFKRLYHALAPGGRIAIIDMIPDDARTGPPFAIAFALNMLVNTANGGTYTLAEYTEWLTRAGFARVESIDIGSHSPLIVGSKE